MYDPSRVMISFCCVIGAPAARDLALSLPRST
jgi:hypothetical protein